MNVFAEEVFQKQLTQNTLHKPWYMHVMHKKYTFKICVVLFWLIASDYSAFCAPPLFRQHSYFYSGLFYVLAIFLLLEIIFNKILEIFIKPYAVFSLIFVYKNFLSLFYITFTFIPLFTAIYIYFPHLTQHSAANL